MNLAPVVLESTSRGERSWDIYSRLLKDRIIFVSGEITDDLSTSIVAQLLYLESENPNEKVHMYINSPGGSITAGMAIIDTMKYIECEIHTICVGMCASMGAMILSQGDRRYSLPNGEVMIHQPLGGRQGQATDIDLYARHIKMTKDKMAKLLADVTKKPLDIILQDIERDYYMSAEEAVDYGIVESIIESKVK